MPQNLVVAHMRVPEPPVVEFLEEIDPTQVACLDLEELSMVWYGLSQNCFLTDFLTTRSVSPVNSAQEVQLYRGAWTRLTAERVHNVLKIAGPALQQLHLADRGARGE